MENSFFDKVEDATDKLDIESVSKGLCPCCDRVMQKLGNIYKISHYENDDELYYMLCKRCSKKIERANGIKKEKIRKIINERLDKMFSLYAAKIIRTDHFSDILSRKNEKNAIAELPVNNSWNDDDKKFFKKNPNRKFRARKVYKGELEETHKGNNLKVKEVYEKNICFAIVHKISDSQRVRAYVSDLSHTPYKEENYVAALFLVMLSPTLTVNDLDKVHKEINERKINIEKMGLDFSDLYKN